jgi:rsbT co-antagonist protein RsbR
MTEAISTEQQRTLRTRTELMEAVTAIVGALRRVDSGDLSVQVATPYPPTEPMGALVACVNMMISQIAERREQNLSYQRELEGQITTIDKQRAAIRDLSTPIIEVWAGILCVPIVGVLDSSRASEMTSALLNAVVEKKARYTIIDITGIDAMDTGATDHFLRMARAVRLLGADCVLSGLSPGVARTITHMGIDLQGVQSHRTLRDALQHYVERKRNQRSARTPNGH